MPTGPGTYGNKRGRPRKKSVGMGAITPTLGKKAAKLKQKMSRFKAKVRRTAGQMAALRKAQKASAMRRKK